MQSKDRTLLEKFILFAAEGFGAGRFPVAPGTVGSLVGFGWIYILLLPGHLVAYIAGIVLGFFGAVWIGGAGELISGRTDPGSIVIDEIAALPLAFLGALVAESNSLATPSFGSFFHGTNIIALLVAFAGFRLFDVAKPWLIGRAQDLPGGWGLVVDDFLAALPVIPLTYAAAHYF